MGGGCGEPKSLRAVYSCDDGSPSAKSDSGFSSDVVFSRHAPRVCLRSSGALAVAPAVLVVSVPSHNLHTAVTLGGRSFRDTTYWGGALLPSYVAPNNHRPTTAAPTDHNRARPSTHPSTRGDRSGLWRHRARMLERRSRLPLGVFDSVGAEHALRHAATAYLRAAGAAVRRCMCSIRTT